MASDVPDQDRVQEQLRRVRADLMGGRGPGATEAEVAVHTRNRTIIAGEYVTGQLERSAQQTAHAREDTAGITDSIEHSSRQLALVVGELATRLSPRRVAERTTGKFRARVRVRPVLIVVVGALALVLVIRLRRGR